MNRSAVKFTNGKALVTFYFTLVKSILEYTCIVPNLLDA